MSRYNPAHAHLFGGVQAPAQQRKEALRRSCVVELVRTNLDEARARFKLDDASKLELRPVVGDHLECTLSWPDGESSINVEIYAVHPGGYVDVRNYAAITDDTPARVTLRRWNHERNRQMASEAAEKIESARRVYAAALGTKDEGATKLELERLVAEAKQLPMKAVR